MSQQAKLVHENIQDLSFWTNSKKKNQKTCILGFPGYSENLQPHSEGPHYGHQYELLAQGFQKHRDCLLCMIPLPEHDPFQQGKEQKFVGNNFNFINWGEKIFHTFQSEGWTIQGLYGNSTGASLALHLLPKLQKKRLLPNPFELFLTSPAVELYLKPKDKLLKQIMRFPLTEKIFSHFAPSLFLPPDPKEFQEWYPNFDLQKVKPFERYSISFLKSFLNITDNPQILIKKYNQNLQKVPISFVFNGADPVVKTPAIQKLIHHLGQHNWPVKALSFSPTSHSLILTDNWIPAITFLTQDKLPSDV